MKPLIAILGLVAAGSLAPAALGQVDVVPARPMPGVRTAAPAAAASPALPAVPADQLKGKLVSLTLRDVPMRQALQQLGEAGGMQFNLGYRDWGGNNQQEKRISLEVHDKPLWDTLLELLKRGEFDSPMSITVGVPGSGNYSVAGRAFASGPFLVVARNISHENTIQPGITPAVVRGAAAVQSPVRLELYVLVDPSLHIARVNSQCFPTRATDDKGNSLVPQGTSPVVSGGYFGPGNFNLYNVNVTLQYPPPEVQAGQKITLVEGTIQATVNDTETAEIQKGQKLEKQLGTGGGIKLTVEWGAPADLTAWPGFPRVPTDAPLAAIVRVESDPNQVSPAEFSTWAQSAIQIKLLDAAGNAIRSSMYSSGGGAASRQMSYRFLPGAVPDGRGGSVTPGDPVKAIVEIPTSIKSVEIPFRVENIPLP